MAAKLCGTTLQAHRALGAEGKDENQKETGKMMWSRGRQRRALHVAPVTVVSCPTIDGDTRGGGERRRREVGGSGVHWAFAAEHRVSSLMQVVVWEADTNDMDQQLRPSGCRRSLPSYR